MSIVDKVRYNLVSKNSKVTRSVLPSVSGNYLGKRNFQTNMTNRAKGLSYSSGVTSIKEDHTCTPMLRFQGSLPHLPVPTLEETSAKYIKSIHPAVSKKDFEKSKHLVEDFVKKGGVGEKLQERLVNKAKDPKTLNWMYDWWNDAAYLSYRDPVVPYVSYFYAYKDDPLRKNPARRGAAIITAALSFHDQVVNGTLEPEYMKKQPLCMESYKYMFHACRVPAPGKDIVKTYNAAENPHITVVHKNRYYKLFYEFKGKRLSAVDLEAQLNKIYAAHNGIVNNETPIGVLTSRNRDKWAAAYQELSSIDPINVKSLESIQSSAFILALDSHSPVTLKERAHMGWHGDARNRYYDKPCEFIVADNGVAAFTGEHSMMDGTPTCRLNDYINGVIANNKIDYGNKEVTHHLPEPEELEFKINSKLQESISDARREFNDTIERHQLEVLQYQKYGKNSIKKFKASPDAFVQMIIQLAYYRMYGECRPTYESASTRNFILGRTETTRTLSDDSLNFVKTFEDPYIDKATKLSLARTAIESHIKYISEASEGKGVDRHFFGLKNCLQKGEEVPPIFNDKAFKYSSSWYLSTSQLSSEYFNGYGWSQVIDDGFGVAYMVNNDWLNFNIVSKSLGSDKLKYYLKTAADDMYDLFNQELLSSPPKAKL